MSGANVVIVNPKSAGGATERTWLALHGSLFGALGEVQVLFTDAPQAATRLTREALTRGASLVVSVGGDGTHNEVVNGFFADGEPINPEAAFGLIPAGTGGDFRRTFQWSPNAREAIERLGAGTRRKIDLGKVTFRTPEGGRGTRYFVNVSSFGISGEVVARANQSSKVLGGKLSFAMASLRALAGYRDRRVRLSLDGEPSRELDITTVAICNGQYFGGGMWVGPAAKIDDGLFDITIWRGFGLSDFVFRSHHLYGGTHVKLPQTTTARVRTLSAESDEEVLLDVDGEQPGRLPVTYEILPGALWMRV